MSARSLMVQGTMSGVGKSLIVAGLCRILAQDGCRVAPFKSQNMALNSAITQDGLEMGRAQAMQAEAAGIEPTCAMNPVLLKPTTDVGSQVIVNGRPVGTMPARDYFAFRHTLVDPIMEAYHELGRTYDVILIEGAGSPAELNLRRDDIVNMGIAKRCGAPVLLVGDIDRGGVFAQLIGTYELLEEDERRLVRASVVNKFRGDPTLFADGIDILCRRMGIPVAGLVPFMHVDLDEEDGTSGQLLARDATGMVDVAVIRLPRISNFTDFAPLDVTQGASVRYVSRLRDLGRPDLVIIPGTKSTIADLAWLRTSGLGGAVVRLAHEGVAVLGICGGYQMLGESLADPLGMEGGGEAEGLGLLPVRTVFGTDKRTVRSRGAFGQVGGVLAGLAGKPFAGYEIHMGVTTASPQVPCAPLLAIERQGGGTLADGCQRGNVYWCYVHGLFDRPEANQALVAALMEARGLDPAAAQAVDMGAYRQAQYDALADGLRASMDMGLVRQIIEAGV